MTDSKLIEPGFPFRPELEINNREIDEQLLLTYFGKALLTQKGIPQGCESNIQFWTI